MTDFLDVSDPEFEHADNQGRLKTFGVPRLF